MDACLVFKLDPDLSQLDGPFLEFLSEIRVAKPQRISHAKSPPGETDSFPEINPAVLAQRPASPLYLNHPLVKKFQQFVPLRHRRLPALEKIVSPGPPEAPISAGEFAEEMLLGLPRGAGHIWEEVKEHPGVTVGVVGGILAIGKWVPNPYLKWISRGLLALGIGFSTYTMGKGVLEGVRALQENSRTRLKAASLQFGVGSLGLGLTVLGMKVGSRFGADAARAARWGTLAAALHSPDEIMAAFSAMQGWREY